MDMVWHTSNWHTQTQILWWLAYNMSMKQITREQLITALIAEDDFIRHDTDCDDTPEEFLRWLLTLSYDELVTETCTDDEYFTLDEYMEIYG